MLEKKIQGAELNIYAELEITKVSDGFQYYLLRYESFQFETGKFILIYNHENLF